MTEEKKNCTCEEECSCEEKKNCNEKCTCQERELHEKEKKQIHKKEKNKKEIEELKKQLEQKEAEKQELLNKVQYAQAEMINFRRRKEEETQNRLKYANQDLINELLPILDNFERAIGLDDNNLSDELSKFLVGFKMMYANLSEVLKKFGVEEIDCVGKEFNPNEMQALMIENDPTFKDDEVMEVLLKGYKLKDRIIRAASVKVNKLENNNKGDDKNE